MPSDISPDNNKSPRRAATRVFLRGLSISLPPILTLVILLWIGQGLNTYIVQPIGDGVRWVIASTVNEIRQEKDLLPSQGLPPLPRWGNRYRVTPQLDNSKEEFKQQVALAVKSSDPERSVDREVIGARVLAERYSSDVYVPMGGGYIPLKVHTTVENLVGPAATPPTAIGVYMDYVTSQYFLSFWHLSALALALTIVGIYFIGRLFNARLGAWFVHKFETEILGRLPFISNVYSSVKQVTDFLLTEREVEYSRVVAIEYPRRGIWSLGLVTGDSMLDITTAAGEPMISVLVPSSPMPVTGYTMNVPRSEVVDLNLTVDQAFQFCISCGVLVPPHQMVTPETLKQAFGKRLPPAALPPFASERTSDSSMSNPS